MDGHNKKNTKSDCVLKDIATTSQVAVIKNSFPCVMMIVTMKMQSIRLTLGGPKCTQASEEIRAYTLIRSIFFSGRFCCLTETDCR